MWDPAKEARSTRLLYQPPASITAPSPYKVSSQSPTLFFLDFQFHDCKGKTYLMDRNVVIDQVYATGRFVHEKEPYQGHNQPPTSV